MRKYILIAISVWIMSTSFVLSQSIEVDCVSKPLNELLLEWRDKYNIQFSFNDALLAQYPITIKQSFASVDQALEAILRPLPLNVEQSASVYVIFPEERVVPIKTYTLIGKVVERGSGEPLSFAHISVNNLHTVADLRGMFSFNLKGDSLVELKASHLGCYVLDTIIGPGDKHTLYLQPSVIGMKEIVVVESNVEKAIQIGQAPGLLSLNHHIARYLPGNGDNSVFNLLRLQPGVLAAGEQSNDLIIWGSYEGTSRVLFDGFTIWGLKNFNDNISAVNPYMAKSIDVRKGGYGATHEDVVGGLVSIYGKNGSNNKFGANLFLNNQVLNSMVEIPLFKKSSLVLAFRQTYYNLFNEDDLNYIVKLNEDLKNKITAYPDYKFRDFNLKYSFQGDNGDLFYISLLQGQDDFKLTAIQDLDKSEWHQQTNELNKQNGGTAYYGKTWKNGNTSDIRFSYSGLLSSYNNYRSITVKRNGNEFVRRNLVTQNDVKESSLKQTNTFKPTQSHTITAGFDLISNQVVMTEDTFSYRYVDLSQEAGRLTLFAEDEIRLANKVKFVAGLRYNNIASLGKHYLDPRLQITVGASEHLSFNASWGRYHQFLVKSSVVDELDNFRYSWTLADDEEIPVMQSTHYVLGGAYTKDNFMCSVDAYYKFSDGITRYVRKRNTSEIYSGKNQSYGIDFYVKQDIRKHSVWASYSLSKTAEYFDFFPDNEYRRAYHDQRHELKLAALFNLGRFHLSAGYVYGSGFPLYNDYIKQEYTEPDYNRLDMALIYDLNLGKVSSELGLSVLNVTNAQNVKYSSFQRVPINQVNTVYINSEAVPFTPLLYFKLKF